MLSAYLHQVHEDYDCMLNQTNIGHNNNKFYVIQVIKANQSFYSWNRWGRVVSLLTVNYIFFNSVELVNIFIYRQQSHCIRSMGYILHIAADCLISNLNSGGGGTK